MNVVLSKDITTENGYDFTLDSSLLSTYYVQAITIPCYDTLTVSGSITPVTWSTTAGGGIVALRTTGDCTVNGSILTHGKGAVRYDLHQMTNSKLIDRFLCSQGGGVFISCGGTVTIASTARLVVSWSGAGDGSNWAASYGGKGGSTANASGGSGGVGGGGCGGNGGNSTATSWANGASGGGGQNKSNGTGGTGVKGLGEVGTINGGKYGGGNGNYYAGAGGGGAGGNGGYGYGYTQNVTRGNLSAGLAGTSIILIANTISVHTNALSTGGGCGCSDSRTHVGAAGGGRAGFCYIACEEHSTTQKSGTTTATLSSPTAQSSAKGVCISLTQQAQYQLPTLRGCSTFIQRLTMSLRPS